MPDSEVPILRYYLVTRPMAIMGTWGKVKSLSKDIDTAKINKHFHFEGFGTKNSANIDRNSTE